MEPIFFYLILLSIISMGFHSSLLTIFVRKLDGLTITVYRNMSFLITMLPLLFFTSFSEILRILEYLPELIIASLSAVVAFSARLTALKHLPLGLGSAVRQVIYVVLAFAMGSLFLQESSAFLEILIIFIILTAATALSIMKIDVSHLHNANTTKGLLLILVSGVFHTLAFFFFTILAREINPYVATYFWESLIGVFALIIALTLGGKHKIPKLKLLPTKEIFYITIISALTIVGTLSFGFAVTIGDFAIASGLMTTLVVFQTIMAYFLFKEKINLKQGAAILVIVLGVLALKVFV